MNNHVGIKKRCPNTLINAEALFEYMDA